MAAISTSIIPWCRQLATLLTTMAVSGFALGSLDTGSNVWCLDLWEKDSGPFMQALHFTFGLGSFVAPLLAEPFLSPSAKLAEARELMDDTNDTLSANATSNSMDENPLNTTLYGNTTAISNGGYFIEYAYGIVAVYMLLVTICFLLVFILKPIERKAKQNINGKQKSKADIKFSLSVVLLTTLLFVFYAGLEMAYGQFLTSFAVKGNLKLSKSTGSFMTSVFWGTYTATRGVSVILAAKFSALCMICTDMTIIVIAGIMLVLFGNTVVHVLWAGTAILGIGMASVFPTVLAWVERYVKVSNKKASMFVVSTAVGEMLVPLLVGQFIDEHPAILLYVALAAGICCTITFGVMWRICSIHGVRS